jgi:ATP-dependent DNA helicase RecQ
VNETDTRRALSERFGHAAFRPGQEDVVLAVLKGEDVVAVMPTGGGKSLCYQLPALLLDGVTLVVSPLIALMKDQVDALQALGHDATFVNSSLDQAEQRERLRQAAAGRWKLLYVAPERLGSARFLESAASMKVARLAVDEAHCISQWGHDFRPDYARLGELKNLVGDPPTAAFTATATLEVREDVVRQLRLANPRVFVAGFERPNLRLIVRRP